MLEMASAGSAGEIRATTKTEICDRDYRKGQCLEVCHCISSLSLAPCLLILEALHVLCLHANLPLQATLLVLL